MTLDKKTLALLACPLCKGRLVWSAEQQELICRGDKLAFSVRDDIPVLLVNEARELTNEELEKLPS
ncbi:MAG: Trm112 family protein [Idiomarina sp.]